MKRTVFFISDRTGITAEALGHSLLTQFQVIPFDYVILPFIETEKEASVAVSKINTCFQQTGQKPIVFSTVVNPNVASMIRISQGFVIDFFNSFIGALEAELGISASHSAGLSHGMSDYESYKIRIDSINFTLSCDDGMRTQDYKQADVILVGVSRSGKTPTCLYLALQFGVYAANFPITEEELNLLHLPKSLIPFRNKIFGLVIDWERLVHIRNERRPGSQYASEKQCAWETKQVEALFEKEQIPYMSTTHRSVEEIATKILARMGLQRRLF